MRQRSSAFIRACRVLGVDPTTPLEDIARRYRELATALHPVKNPDDPAVTARMAEVNGAWGRIKYEARKRRTRLTNAPIEPQPTATPCTWPHPATVRSTAFEGCDLRPTDGARCYVVMRAGVRLLTLCRHPDDGRLLFARNERGRLVQVNGIEWWTDTEGEVRPVR